MASKVDWGSMGWVYPSSPDFIDLVCPSVPKMVSLVYREWKCPSRLGMIGRISSKCGICGSGIQVFE